LPHELFGLPRDTVGLVRSTSLQMANDS